LTLKSKATANPHIALSAILAAAFDGISKELKLPLPVQGKIK